MDPRRCCRQIRKPTASLSMMHYYNNISNILGKPSLGQYIIKKNTKTVLGRRLDDRSSVNNRRKCIGGHPWGLRFVDSRIIYFRITDHAHEERSLLGKCLFALAVQNLGDLIRLFLQIYIYMYIICAIRLFLLIEVITSTFSSNSVAYSVIISQAMSKIETSNNTYPDNLILININITHQYRHRSHFVPQHKIE